MIQPVGRHLRRRFKLRRNPEQFLRNPTDAVHNIPYTAGHEVRGEVRGELGQECLSTAGGKAPVHAHGFEGDGDDEGYTNRAVANLPDWAGAKLLEPLDGELRELADWQPQVHAQLMEILRTLEDSLLRVDKNKIINELGLKKEGE